MSDVEDQDVSLYMQRFGRCPEVSAFWNRCRDSFLFCAHSMEYGPEKKAEGSHSGGAEDIVFYLSGGDPCHHIFLQGERQQERVGFGAFLHMGNQ